MASAIQILVFVRQRLPRGSLSALRGLLKAHYPKLSSQAFDESPETSSPAAMAASILSIQSHVVYGHVGNSATVFPLQRIGCEVWPIHTVQFSNHTGYPDWRGHAFDAAMIDDCMAGISARGVLAQCDGILSGYMGSAEIGAAILRGVETVRQQNPESFYCCDPVLGDVGRGIYVREGVVEFMRERALPAAALLTPNHFELDLLSNLPSTDMAGARRA